MLDINFFPAMWTSFMNNINICHQKIYYIICPTKPLFQPHFDLHLPSQENITLWPDAFPGVPYLSNTLHDVIFACYVSFLRATLDTIWTLLWAPTDGFMCSTIFWFLFPSTIYSSCVPLPINTANNVFEEILFYSIGHFIVPR